MGMQLDVSVPNAPKFDVCTDSVQSVIPANVTAFVIQPDGNLTHVFTLGLVSYILISYYISLLINYCII